MAKKTKLEKALAKAGKHTKKTRVQGEAVGGGAGLSVISPKPKGGKSVARGAIQGRWAHKSTEQWLKDPLITNRAGAPPKAKRLLKYPLEKKKKVKSARKPKNVSGVVGSYRGEN